MGHSALSASPSVALDDGPPNYNETKMNGGIISPSQADLQSRQEEGQPAPGVRPRLRLQDLREVIVPRTTAQGWRWGLFS